MWDTHTRELFATTMQTTINPPPPTRTTHARARALVACGIGKVGHKVCGGHSTGETPSNIPNLEAKPGNANGTAIDRSWESRTPPQHNHTKTTRPPPPLPARRPGWGAPAYPHPHTPTQRTQSTHNTTQRTQSTHAHARTRTRAVTQGTPSTTTPTPNSTQRTHTTRAHPEHTHPEHERAGSWILHYDRFTETHNKHHPTLSLLF